jgi:hypothetical protein
MKRAPRIAGRNDVDVGLAWLKLSKEVTEEFGFVGGFLNPWHANPTRLS